MSLVSVLVFVFSFLTLANTESNIKNRITEVDLTINGLQDLKWTEDETPCLQQTLQILDNVKNYTTWAVWIWNSMQHPSGSFYGSRYNLGNYDQCLTAPSNTADLKIETQYCLTDVKLTDVKWTLKQGDYSGSGHIYKETDDYLGLRNEVGRRSDIISWGVCLPATCNHASVNKIVKTIYQTNPITSRNPVITVGYCQKATEKTEFSSKYYAFMYTMCALIATAIICTIYLKYINTTDSLLTRIAYCFSIKRNWSSLTRSTENEIPAVTFTKAFATGFTTCIHVFVFGLITDAVGNTSNFDNLFSVKTYTIGNTTQHIDLPVVENFFVMSGFLLMNGLLDKKKNPFISLIQRYVRLIGSLAVFIFYTIAVSEYFGSGPLWNRFNKEEQEACDKTWHLSLLMVNNYVDSENICQLITWYVPCDYHLAIMGTVLFCLWQWNESIGKVTLVATAVMSILLPGFTTYWNRLNGYILFDVEAFINMRTNPVYQSIYIKSHHRIGPYLLGMATGYIMTTYKPAKYRGIIPKGYAYLGLAVSFTVAVKVLAAAPAWCLGEYNAWNAAVYAALNRNIWALATCSCVMFCEYSNIEWIRKFTSWGFFTVVSRLSYGIYITHSVFLLRYLYSQRSPMTYDFFDMVIYGLGLIWLSSLFALFLWLFVESPLSNLANLVLLPKKTQTNVIENKKENSQTKTRELKNTKTT